MTFSHFISKHGLLCKTLEHYSQTNHTSLKNDVYIPYTSWNLLPPVTDQALGKSPAARPISNHSLSVMFRNRLSQQPKSMISTIFCIPDRISKWCTNIELEARTALITADNLYWILKTYQKLGLAGLHTQLSDSTLEKKWGSLRKYDSSQQRWKSK